MLRLKAYDDSNAVHGPENVRSDTERMTRLHRTRFAAVAAASLLFIVLAAGAIWYFDVGSVFERALAPGAVSTEMRPAAGAGSREAEVASWLRAHRREIVRAESEFSIDRRAIAGLIAYESLVNVHLSEYGGLVRWSGIGKVRYKESPLAEGLPASKEVENLGLLPRRTMAQRRAVLRDPRWAIMYIAAIMRGLSDVTRRRLGEDVSCDPAALTTLASSWTLASADAHFSTVRTPYRLAYNFPGNWVAARQDLIVESVGEPALPRCRASIDRDRIHHGVVRNE